MRPSRTALALAEVNWRSLDARWASQACNSDCAAASFEEESGVDVDMTEGEEAKEREEVDMWL